MQTVAFEAFHRSGLDGEQRRISVADLLRAIPYLLTGGLVPPIHIANQVLRLGEFDAGMGGAGKWAPLELNEAEYREVVQDLVGGGRFGRALRHEETPEWVRDRRDWRIWVAERVFCIPAEENRRFEVAMGELDARMKDAASRGDEETRVECLCRLSELSVQHSEFMQKHRRPREPGA